MATPAEKVGVFIARAWKNGNGPYRVRVTRSDDISQRRERVTTTTDIDDICQELRSWWESLEHR